MNPSMVPSSTCIQNTGLLWEEQRFNHNAYIASCTPAIYQFSFIYIPVGLCQTDLYMAEPPAPVLDTATGSLDPGPQRLGIGPGPSRNPGHPRPRSLVGMDSKQSSLSGSTLLKNIQ